MASEITLTPVSTPPPADRNPAVTYLAALSAGSRPAMNAALATAARVLAGGADPTTLPWERIRYQHVQAVRTALVDAGRAPATVNRHLSALRGVAREAWRLGLMDVEAFQRIADVKNVKGSTLPTGRDVTTGELRALFNACADLGETVGARDAAMLSVLFASGLRRAELVALDLGDYDRETGQLTIRSAKGRKDRTAYATNGCAEALTNWLSYRGNATGPLFTPVAKGGRVQIRAMTEQAVYARVRYLARKAGVKHFSPHDLRRSFAGAMLDAGADLATVQAMMGHASPTTTARYDRRGERAKRKAAQLLHVPYTGGRVRG